MTRVFVVDWLESPNSMVLYKREKPGLVLVAAAKLRSVKAPEDSTNDLGFELPIFNEVDPRVNAGFETNLKIRMKMLVAFAWRQALLDTVTFFGVVHNYRNNVMVGMGYTNVKIIPKFEHTPTDLFGFLQIKVDVKSLLGPLFKTPQRKSRHERPWVI